MDAHENLRELVLMRLGEGCPALTQDCGRSFAEAAAVCLEDQGHVRRAVLHVTGHYTEFLAVIWPGVTDQMRRCHNDPEVATEWGAYGIAILLIQDLVGFTVIERSRKGTGFDYWLGADEEWIFQHKARLEVSGIRSGDDATMRSRIARKLGQTRQSDAMGIPAYVIVVEFSRPMAWVVRK